MLQNEVINLIISSEKGINREEPASVGGISCDGITKKFWDDWRPKNLHRFPDAPSDVEGLADRPEIVYVCYVDYLEDYNVWDLPECLQYIYADFAINAGGAAVKIIQRIVQVDDDGAWGSKTDAAVIRWKQEFDQQLLTNPLIDNQLIIRFHKEKLAHYKRLVNKNPDEYRKWYKGWKRRAYKVLCQLQQYFESDQPTPCAMHDDNI